MIEVNQVHFSYDSLGDDSSDTESASAPVVLDGISFHLREGEFVALLGQNGCGKSTLGMLLNGLLLPGSGKVLVDGLDTAKSADILKVRRLVGMVFQDPARQMVASCVKDDIAFGPENLGLPPAEISERLQTTLDWLNIKDLALTESHMLSGGQMQRVAIASILVMQPRYVVLDEPTSMLDPSGRRRVLDLVDKMKKELGLGIVYITHLMDEVLRADRVMVMSKGHIVAELSPLDLFTRTQELRAWGLDVPPIVELAARLRRQGVKIPAEVYSPSQLAEALQSCWRPDLLV